MREVRARLASGDHRYGWRSLPVDASEGVVVIDGVLAKHIEDFCRFMRPGDKHEVIVNEHACVMVKLSPGSSAHGAGFGFFVACSTCKALVGDDVRKPHIAISKHVDENVIRPEDGKLVR